jgi:hypothetical protein
MVLFLHHLIRSLLHAPEQHCITHPPQCKPRRRGHPKRLLNIHPVLRSQALPHI